MIPKLSSFSFLEDDVRVRGVTAICNELIKPDARVQHFTLGYGDWNAMSVLLTMLRTNISIRQISLYEDLTVDEDCRLLEEALKYNTTLTSINFCDDYFNSNIISHIESALAVNQTLISVNYKDKPLDSALVQVALAKNRCIQDLRSKLSKFLDKSD